MSDIIIAGAGHGGLVAAAKLAEAGHNVTVYEKMKRGGYPLEQKDSFDANAMIYAGIEIPEHYHAKNNRISFIPLDGAPVLTMPENTENKTLTVDRREFFEYLAGLAEKAGVKFVYECEIFAPVIYGSRVCGIKTSLGDFCGDLVIDACGVYSPLRSQLPEFMQIENHPDPYDVLHTYRAYFENITDAPQPETDYNVYVTVDGTEGMSWVVTEDNEVDILIARFDELEYSEIADILKNMSESNPHMGRELLHGGKIVDIPVREPLAMLVADGYAAVGDSAFMTYSAKGSGIAYSIQAGTMLAQTVLEDECGRFTAETLWDYQKTFFKEIGFGACRIAIVKSLLPYMTAQEVRDMLKEGLLSTEELADFSSNAVETLVKSKVILKKAKLLGDAPELREKLMNAVAWQGKFTLIEPSFPNRYDLEDVEKWVKKYNNFFDSIRYSEEIKAD